jgi:porin
MTWLVLLGIGLVVTKLHACPLRVYPTFPFGGYVADPVFDESGKESSGDGCGLEEEDVKLIFSDLADKGISLELIYTGETFGNFRGGLDTNNAYKYQGLMDVVVTADLEKLGIGQGVFFMNAQQMHGEGLSENYVGDFQVLSNIDAPSLTQVSEWWWEGSVLSDRFRVKLGRQDANADFNVVDVGGDFISSSFGFSPTIPLPTFPLPTIGASFFYDVSEDLMLKFGVFDGGFDLNEFGLSEEEELFLISEFKEKFELGGKPGDVHAGCWYHTGQFENLANSGKLTDPLVKNNSYGFYAGLDQMIYQERPEDDDSDEGLAIFFQYGWAPGDRWEAQQYYGTGAVYKGLIGGRQDDLLGVGLAHVEFSRFLADVGTETYIELFYKMQINDRLILQPDLQFIQNPSGVEKNAIAGGLRFELSLR